MNEAYRETIFLLENTKQVLPASFSIVTAFNPCGKLCGKAQNHQHDQSLKEQLKQRHLPFFRVIGASRDLTHQEKSWGIECDEDTAIRLGQLYQQEAIYLVIDGILWLVSCQDTERRANLGPFKERLNGMRDA
jgi:hypothetical protein